MRSLLVQVPACESQARHSPSHERLFLDWNGQEVPILSVIDLSTNFQWCGRLPDRTAPGRGRARPRALECASTRDSHLTRLIKMDDASGWMGENAARRTVARWRDCCGHVGGSGANLGLGHGVQESRRPQRRIFSTSAGVRGHTSFSVMRLRTPSGCRLCVRILGFRTLSVGRRLSDTHCA